MADLTLPTPTFTNGTTADANDVTADLAAIVTDINTNCIRIDGSNNMAAALVLSGNPSSANHAVRKAYLDGPYVYGFHGHAQTFVAGTFQTIEFDQVTDTATAYVPATGVFTVPTAGIFQVNWTLEIPASHNDLVRMRVLADGTAYAGFRAVPSDMSDDSGDTVILNMGVAVKCAAASTIEAQADYDAGGSRDHAGYLTIAWLHG